MFFATKVLYEQLNCLLGHLMFCTDPVEKKQLIEEIRFIRNQLNSEDEIRQKISHMHLINADHKDPSQYF